MITFCLILMLVLLVLRVPVPLAIAGCMIPYFMVSSLANELLIQRFVSGILPFPLLAIPFFVLAGVIMANGGIATRILGLGNACLGHLRGGLAQVMVFNSVIIGGMSGSGNADAAIDAKVLVPVMTKYGYRRGFATALAAATGLIAPILPPGIGLIIYGYLTDVSIGRLFMAGVVPALLMAAALSAMVAFVARKQQFTRYRDKRASVKEMATHAMAAFWALLMPVLLIIGLRIGVFTPTELGAVAALYALVVSMVFYREIKIRDLPEILRETVVITAIIMLIIGAGNVLGWVITLERVPQTLISSVTDFTSHTFVVLLIINVVLLLLGSIVDSTALLIVCAPIVAALGLSFGVDPVHLGVVVVMNLTIGAVTPPIGSIMFTVCAITGTSVREYTREILPFLGAVVAVLFLVTFAPAVALFLPDLMFG